MAPPPHRTPMMMITTCEDPVTVYKELPLTPADAVTTVESSVTGNHYVGMITKFDAPQATDGS